MEWWVGAERTENWWKGVQEKVVRKLGWQWGQRRADWVEEKVLCWNSVKFLLGFEGETKLWLLSVWRVGGMERGDYTNTCLLSFPPCKIFIFGIFVFPGKCAVINNNNSFSFFGGQKKIKIKNSILFFKIKTLKIFFFFT